METPAYAENRVPALLPRSAPGRPPSANAAGPTRAVSPKWLVPALLALSAIPLAVGAVRLAELAAGAAITPANARFFASPVPVVVHIVGAAVYALLGAFQFATGFRRRRPGWHRAAGRLLVPCGLLVGLSALWMTLFYAHPADTGALLSAIRLVFGSAWLRRSSSVSSRSGAGMCASTAPGCCAATRSGSARARRC